MKREITLFLGISLLLFLSPIASAQLFDVSTGFTLSQCNDGKDNDGDDTVDRGGCDCNEDGTTDAFRQYLGAHEVALCTRGWTDAELANYNDAFGAAFENECNGQAGTYYYPDDGCRTENDDSEGEVSRLRGAQFAPAAGDEGFLERVWRFLAFAPRR